MTFPTTDFLRNLRFWSLHCSITAFPSFLMAGILVGIFEELLASLAMVVGVLIFILGYTSLSTFLSALNDRTTLLSRALRVALKIRVGLSLIALLGLGVPFLLIFHPDYWAGILAKGILELAYEYVGGGTYNLAESRHFLAILLWTLAVGILLSFLLVFVSFFCLLFVNRQQTAALARVPHPRTHPVDKLGAGDGEP